MTPAAASDRSFLGHPRGLAYLAFTEAWERFSFSGMQAMLVLYMVGELLQPGHVEHVLGFAALRAVVQGLYGPLAAQPLSSIVFGLYTSLIFFMPVLGGYAGDRWFGQHRMVMAGAILMAFGHFLMAFEASFLFALGFLIVGAGCLKGNISKQVGGLYRDDDRRRTDAFQVFSMAMNSGIIIAPLICGTLGELYGWHYGFGAAGVGMLIGLAIYISGQRYLPEDRMARVVDGVERARGEVLPSDRRVLPILFLVFVITSCFLLTAGQLGNVYSLWLRDHVDRHVAGHAIPITWFQSLTPLFSVALTPLVLRLWQRQGNAGTEPSLFVKMAIGLAMVGAGMLLLAALSLSQSIDWWWLMPTHVLVALAYIFVYPIGIALFSRIAPEGARAMYIGIYFLTSFVASNFVGYFGGFYATMSPAAFWGLHGCLGLGGAVLALLAIRPSSAVLAGLEQPTGVISHV